jgi:hypothetical protein
LDHRHIFRKHDLAHATSLIREVLEVAGQTNIIEDTRQSFEEIGLLDAIQKHDDDAIYNWLAEAICRLIYSGMIPVEHFVLR